MSRHTWLLRGVFAGLVVSALEAGRAFQPSLRSRAVYRALRLFRVREVLARLDLQGGMPDTGRIMRPPEGVTVEPLTVAGRYAERLVPVDAASDSMILYLHGGAYVTGGVQMYRSLAGGLAAASGMRALTLDYRLAPRYPFPAALDDAAAAYQWLVAQGFAPGQITLAGDSAGGGLALALLLHLRDSNISLPAGAALLSPWMDLTGAGQSMAALADRDPLLSWAMLDPAAGAYAADTPRDYPLISPVFGRMDGLPPLLILVGEREILLDDAARVARQAARAGVDVTLTVAPGMWHVWPLFGPLIPEAGDAIQAMAAFLRARVGQVTG